MTILIIKDGHVFARAEADGGNGQYTLRCVSDADMPPYPAREAGRGKYWELDLVEGAPTWIEKDRPLTAEERLSLVETAMDEIRLAWRAGEAVAVGDRRCYNGNWYTCLQAHTTQADWTPALVPALWQAEGQ